MITKQYLKKELNRLQIRKSKLVEDFAARESISLEGSILTVRKLINRIEKQNNPVMFVRTRKKMKK